jgi:hypothetical protein
VADFRSQSAHGLWQEAIKIRQEWLDHGLSTQLYAWIRDPHPRGKPPLASDLAMAVSRLHSALGADVAHADPELSPARRGKRGEPWPELPPAQALEAGVPLGVVLHQGIGTALHRSLAQGFRAPVRTALAGDPARVPVCWYGQQDAAWIAYCDALHRLGLARYRPEDLDHLGYWAGLARSCGWWWPGEEVCVVVDRPGLARAEPLPGTWHDEVRRRPLPRWLAPAAGVIYSRAGRDRFLVPARPSLAGALVNGVTHLGGCG